MELSDQQSGGLTTLESLILSYISDDYESLEYIDAHVRADPQLSQTEISDESIDGALLRLIELKFAQAFLLSAQPPHVTLISYPAEINGDFWFYATELGKAATKATCVVSQSTVYSRK